MNVSEFKKIKSNNCACIDLKHVKMQSLEDETAQVLRFNRGQSLELGLVVLFASCTAAPVFALAFERFPEFNRQRVQDGALVRRRADASAAAERGRASALRVGCLKQPAHEAEPSLPDVRAAGEHVKDGVDSAAEVGEGCDVGSGRGSSFNH